MKWTVQPEQKRIWSDQTQLKIQSNEFVYLQFFSSFEPAWANDQWVNTFSNLVRFSLLFKFLGYTVLLRWVSLPEISYCAESCDLSRSYLKGQSNEILTPHFYSSFEPAWTTDKQVKTFFILVSFSPRYSIGIFLNPWGVKPQRVNLPGVSYPGESSNFSRS